MKMKGIIVAVALSALSLAATAKESNHYLPYFDVDTIVDLSGQIELYNEENGYWENSLILNPELHRYLSEKQIMSKDSETNGFWM